MAIDLVALKAKIAAQKAAASVSTITATITASNPVANTVSVISTTEETKTIETPAPTINAPATLGTSKTSEIDHLDFIAKMNSLAEAIHKQHPTMPVLLQQIHKQLRNDPELVTTLDEDAIGVVVKGLQVQTKTELVVEAVKKASSGRSKKNPALSTDMF